MPPSYDDCIFGYYQSTWPKPKKKPIPSRYVGIPDAVEDEEAYEEKIAKLTTELKIQMTEAEKLDKEIKTQLEKIGIEL